MIQWNSLDAIGLPADVAAKLQLVEVPQNRKIGGRWAGRSGRNPSKFFALQLHVSKNDPDDRMAVLIAEAVNSETQSQPLQITQEHVAEVAGFLGFRWFEWLPVAPGKVIIEETFTADAPPPEDMDKLFDDLDNQ